MADEASGFGQKRLEPNPMNRRAAASNLEAEVRRTIDAAEPLGRPRDSEGPRGAVERRQDICPGSHSPQARMIARHTGMSNIRRSSKPRQRGTCRGSRLGRIDNAGMQSEWCFRSARSFPHLLYQSLQLRLPLLGVLRLVQFFSIVATAIRCHRSGGIDDHLGDDPARAAGRIE